MHATVSKATEMTPLGSDGSSRARREEVFDRLIEWTDALSSRNDAAVEAAFERVIAVIEEGLTAGTFLRHLACSEPHDEDLAELFSQPDPRKTARKVFIRPIKHLLRRCYLLLPAFDRGWILRELSNALTAYKEEIDRRQAETIGNIAKYFVVLASPQEMQAGIERLAQLRPWSQDAAEEPEEGLPSDLAEWFGAYAFESGQIPWWMDEGCASIEGVLRARLLDLSRLASSERLIEAQQTFRVINRSLSRNVQANALQLQLLLDALLVRADGDPPA